MQWLSGSKQQNAAAPTLQYMYYPVYGKDSKGNKTAQPMYYYAVPVKSEGTVSTVVEQTSPAKTGEKRQLQLPELKLPQMPHLPAMNLEAVHSGLNLVLSNMETIIPTIIAGLFVRNLAKAVGDNQLAVPVGHVAGGAQNLASLLLLPPRLALQVAGFALSAPFKILRAGARIVRPKKKVAKAAPQGTNGSAPHMNGVAASSPNPAPTSAAPKQQDSGSALHTPVVTPQKPAAPTTPDLAAKGYAIPSAQPTTIVANMTNAPAAPATPATSAHGGAHSSASTPAASTSASTTGTPARAPAGSSPGTSARKIASAKGQGLGKSCLPPRRPTAASVPAIRKRFVSASDNVGALGDIQINFQGFGWPENITPQTTDLFSWAMAVRRNIEEGKEWETYGEPEN